MLQVAGAEALLTATALQARRDMEAVPSVPLALSGWLFLADLLGARGGAAMRAQTVKLLSEVLTRADERDVQKALQMAAQTRPGVLQAWRNVGQAGASQTTQQTQSSSQARKAQETQAL